VLSLENVISMGKAVSKQFSCNSVFLHPDCQSIRWIQQDQNCFFAGRGMVSITLTAFR